MHALTNQSAEIILSDKCSSSNTNAMQWQTKEFVILRISKKN